MPDPPSHTPPPPLVPIVADRPAPTFGHRPPMRLKRRRLRVAVALSGGGANYVGIAGAMSVLLEQDWLEIVCLSGTSAGALCAALVSGRRHPSEKLWDLVRRTLPGEKIPLPTRIPSPPDWAIYDDGDLVRELRSHLTDRMGQMYFPTAITTVQLHPKRERVWSSWEHPNVDLTSAVRSSISIPFAFKPYHVNRWEGARKKVIAASLVDGGLSSNLPVDIEWPVPFDQVWAIDVQGEPGSQPDLSMPWGLGAAVVDVAISLNEREDIEDARRKYRDGFRLMPLRADSSASFHITTERAKRMWVRGRREAKRWLHQVRRDMEGAS